jgi:hypothetical protein
VRGVDRAEFAWWVVLLSWRLAGPLSEQVFPQQYHDDEDEQDDGSALVRALGIVRGRSRNGFAADDHIFI